MRFILVLIISFLGSGAWAAVSPSNLNKNGVGLNGFDPVSYFSDAGPQKGAVQHQTKYEDAIYYFATEANKEKFLKDPKKYEPQFGGWCAYAVADSKDKVDVDPKSFVIQDGRLLLFYNGWLGDTKKKWLHTKNKDPKQYLIEADANWPEVKPKDP